MNVKQMLSKVMVRTGGSLSLQRRANRVAPTLSNKWQEELGVGQSWMPLSYGEYYPRSSFVYSAIKVRQDAVVRVPLKVYRHGGSRLQPLAVRGELPPHQRNGVEPVDLDHPLRRLLDSPNPFWTRGDLWRATETYLGLWGSAYWGLE